MLNPNQAFIRLKKDGKFTEDDVTWDWALVGNGYKIMTSQKGTNYPTYHRGFYVNDNPIRIGVSSQF